MMADGGTVLMPANNSLFRELSDQEQVAITLHSPTRGLLILGIMAPSCPS